MPKEGYTSITINTDVYKTLKKAYDKNKKSLQLQGIYSLTGFFTQLAIKHLEKINMITVDWDTGNITYLDSDSNNNKGIKGGQQ